MSQSTDHGPLFQACLSCGEYRKKAERAQTNVMFRNATLQITCKVDCKDCGNTGYFLTADGVRFYRLVEAHKAAHSVEPEKQEIPF